ncbi:hypothetical protein [Seohaeicola zhoushanensis]|uniref:Apolipoprotein acyltransferase n=1 Tax=Seohaeicola zhoushanensis TaxID=1569283 RepID=A0A8J3MAD0_9RHOB|nr:hypothetical protein [Seohaeicola zhoushanensis]GHF56152.1 hypothetical protein GCM10017056_29700 [Seohaeicola zhoushanensis]
MIVIGGGLLGLIIGVLTAKKRGGSGADMAQYGAGYGIAFAVVGMIATVILERMLV